jgi:hypothetical protein
MQHPSKKLQFLVGLKGKADLQALGGAWDPSDGGHPEQDPAALVRTATRTFKEATGLDLSPCSQVRGQEGGRHVAGFRGQVCGGA